MSTLASHSSVQPHRSLWRARLERLAGPTEVDEFLLEEANLRGYWGASTLDVRQRPTTPWLADEDLVVGLLMPHARADHRIFKLVVRMVQSGRLDAARLTLRARREHADTWLYWLLLLVPEVERNEALTLCMNALGPGPRGYVEPKYAYDAKRLVRRPASKESLWRTPRN